MDLVREREEIQGRIDAMVKDEIPILTVQNQLIVAHKGKLHVNIPDMNIAYNSEFLLHKHNLGPC